MKILVAIEDEHFGKAIADFIAEHEWPEGSEIQLLHMIEPIYVNAFSGYPSELIASYNEERERAAKSLLLSVGTEIAKHLPQLPIKEVIVKGQPKEVIVRTAKDWPADLIIVGSHGRSGIGQFLLGSVSMSVLSAAPCSVMVVKLPKQETQEKENADAVKKDVKKETAASSAG